MEKKLTNEPWSSGDDRTVLSECDNEYEKRLYLNRYAFVADKVMRFMPPSGRLIDCACGDGAGTAFLSEQFRDWEIVGVDVDMDTIDIAQHKYGTTRVGYIYGSIDHVLVCDVDVFVCLETLEHVTKEVMHAALKNISQNILRPGGKFVVSMPRLRPRESTVKRPGHINELYYSEFKYVLGEYFPLMDFYSSDRYGNIVNDTPDANCMFAICTTWPKTKIFEV